MKTKLKNLASVQMGYSFRSRLEPEQTGNIAVIQMKDLTEDNLVDRQSLVLIELNDFKEHHKVELNDLVFRSRGQTNTAALVDVSIGSSVVAAPLLRIRIEKDSILPAYLCWFINQPSSQAYMQSKATGTAIRMIGKSVVDDLEVIVPSIELQQHIVKLEKLSSQEQHLMNKLSIKKRLLMNKVLIDLAATIQ
ncbi:EcoKI restriction-modification system protein HsdS [Legionella santicrucis]|uniref:EcoKI restriction-modification system protein HsdS n=1 Tax=Legionella santicrucis TaxID=45074 RepID=A0A0W0Z0K3_9GAMM|nr:restriction endonuclease subunit S [Legionella santicrucis]KTD62651.1 EcoKI restriction-modification system protein HsdS [Legionella santicrucis]